MAEVPTPCQPAILNVVNAIEAGDVPHPVFFLNHNCEGPSSEDYFASQTWNWSNTVQWTASQFCQPDKLGVSQCLPGFMSALVPDDMQVDLLPTWNDTIAGLVNERGGYRMQPGTTTMPQSNVWQAILEDDWISPYLQPGNEYGYWGNTQFQQFHVKNNASQQPLICDPTNVANMKYCPITGDRYTDWYAGYADPKIRRSLVSCSGAVFPSFVGVQVNQISYDFDNQTDWDWDWDPQWTLVNQSYLLVTAGTQKPHEDYFGYCAMGKYGVHASYLNMIDRNLQDLGICNHCEYDGFFPDVTTDQTNQTIALVDQGGEIGQIFSASDCLVPYNNPYQGSCGWEINDNSCTETYVSNVECTVPINGSVSTVTITRTKDWDEVLVDACAGTTPIQLGGLRIERYQPGAPACVPIMNEICTNAGKLNSANGAKYRTACTCLLHRARIQAQYANLDLPVQCFADICNVATPGVYRDANMLVGCNATLCEQVLNINGSALVAEGHQTMTCNNQIYQLDRNYTPVVSVPPKVDPVDPQSRGIQLGVIFWMALGVLVIVFLLVLVWGIRKFRQQRALHQAQQKELKSVLLQSIK